MCDLQCKGRNATSARRSTIGDWPLVRWAPKINPIQGVLKNNSNNKGEDFRYLYITTQITHTYTDTCGSKGGTLGGQHRLWARFTQLEPPPRQSPSSASQGSCQGKQKQSRRGWRFSRPVHAHFLPRRVSQQVLQQQTRPRYFDC